MTPSNSRGVDFWSGTRVLITGASGFLGKHTIKALAERGVPSPITPRSKEYDLVNGDAVRRLYADTKPEVVIHLAAKVGGIGANLENPGRFFYDNLMMGVQLFEEGRKAGVKKLVAIGTVCSYPKFTPVPFKEESLWNGYPEETNAPYGLAKKMLLVQSKAYRAQYGFNSIVLMPVNLYGPGDNFDPAVSHVIPALIKKMVDAQERGDKFITCWGDGSPTREFLYVGDCAQGILNATESYDSSEPVNLGSGEEHSIKALANLLAEACDFQGEICWDTSKPNGQPRRKLDVSRAEQQFGFVAPTSFKDGIRNTVEWYRQARSRGIVQ